MLKKTIVYTDYDGNERKEDYYFNLTKLEVNKMFALKENISDRMSLAIKNEDVIAIIEIFEELISKSYGVRSDDGKQFKKSKELAEGFLQTAAFEALLDELMMNEGAMLEFIEGIIPDALVKQLSIVNRDEIQAASISSEEIH